MFFIEFLFTLPFWQAVIYFLCFLVAIVIAMVSHEFMHAYAAVKQGDLTPKMAGRLTLNPVAHFDAFGLICFMIAGFGWAKPVPINPMNFQRYKKGMVLVSLAGVITNIILAFIFVGLSILFMAILPASEFSMYLQFFLSTCAIINVYLTIFNLLPIYPLDGFSLLSTFLKYENKFVVFMQRYGMFILLGLMITGALGWVLSFLGNGVVMGFEYFWSFVFGM